ncbi:hypothetical protein [Cellulomonas aerilata]|uniref:Uncharacterized protein n=1 Tax=Cellulomonas aerilata TaxID=515326 RepID=A0A512DCZ9_9CELL|nr:hypothetical protein [Cellulomonas aerilata]GEO34348.1 hypothetical protein CAE01nite_20730 [Cellulomonas aerilata]
MPSHRVLTLSFELHVPEGLRANIRGARIDAAIVALKSAVQSLAPSHFPWADRIVVRSEWSYRWLDSTDVITMPPTPDNTVTEGASGVPDDLELERLGPGEAR